LSAPEVAIRNRHGILRGMTKPTACIIGAGCSGFTTADEDYYTGQYYAAR